jgi:hypothetical protein
MIDVVPKLPWKSRSNGRGEVEQLVQLLIGAII